MYISSVLSTVHTSGWHYAPGVGWEGAFLPLSEKCKTAGRSVVWAADRKNHQVSINMLQA